MVEEWKEVSIKTSLFCTLDLRMVKTTVFPNRGVFPLSAASIPFIYYPASFVLWIL